MKRRTFLQSILGIAASVYCPAVNLTKHLFGFQVGTEWTKIVDTVGDYVCHARVRRPEQGVLQIQHWMAVNVQDDGTDQFAVEPWGGYYDSPEGMLVPMATNFPSLNWDGDQVWFEKQDA